MRAELGYAAASGGTGVAAMGTEVTTSGGQQLPFAAVSRDGGDDVDRRTTLPVPESGPETGTTVTALAAAGGGFTADGDVRHGGPDVVIWMCRRGPGTDCPGWAMATPDVTGLARAKAEKAMTGLPPTAPR